MPNLRLLTERDDQLNTAFLPHDSFGQIQHRHFGALPGVGQARNLHGHTPQCDKVTREEFGACGQQVPASSAGHATKKSHLRAATKTASARDNSHAQAASRGFPELPGSFPSFFLFLLKSFCERLARFWVSLGKAATDSRLNGRLWDRVRAHTT